MSCYEQQYSCGNEAEAPASRSIRSQIEHSSARDWRSANVRPVRDRVSSQEYQNQNESAAECQALYGQYGEWGFSCPSSGSRPSWQNAETTPQPAVKPAYPAEAGPGPVLRPEPGDNSMEQPPVSGYPADFSNYPLGMAYVPVQRWGKIYDLDDGFSRGTIFPELDLPFLAGRCI